MVDYSIVIAYVLTIGVPMLILGIGAYVQETKASLLIAINTFIAFLVYYNYKEIIPTWILITLFILISGILVIIFRKVFGDGD